MIHPPHEWFDSPVVFAIFCILPLHSTRLASTQLVNHHAQTIRGVAHLCFRCNC